MPALDPPAPSVTAPAGKDRRDWLAGALLITALPLLAVGLLLPAISITGFPLFTRTYSLLNGVLLLAETGKYALFILIFLFSIVLPTCKVLVGVSAWAVGARFPDALARLVKLFGAISKWSMLDVFIVALVVVALEGSLFTGSDIHVGIVLFAASVVLSTAGMHRLARVTGR